MHNRPLNPLDEQRERIAQLDSHLRTLLSEERIVKAVVESIEAHQIESIRATSVDDFGGACFETSQSVNLCNALKAVDIKVQDEEDSEEIVVVTLLDRKRLTFHRVEWAWMQDNGKWPWEI